MSASDPAADEVRGEDGSPVAPPAFPPVAAIGLGLALAGLAAVAVTLLALRERGADQPAAAAGDEGLPRLAVLGELPPFELTDRRGDRLSRDDLLGKIWVADFIFTQCGSICPMMTVRMGELREALGEGSDVRFVSISVDPERDTPERLTEYAENYGATGSDWFFLSGDKADIHELARTHFRLGVRDATTDEVAGGGDPILHSQRFVLLDRRSRVRGYYLGAEPDQLRILADDIRTLLDEPPGEPREEGAAHSDPGSRPPDLPATPGPGAG